jgi:hypothetical protein
MPIMAIKNVAEDVRPIMATKNVAENVAENIGPEG